MTDEKEGKIKYDIDCAMCKKTFGFLMREPGDDFGEYYHCKECNEKFRKEREEADDYWEEENYI